MSEPSIKGIVFRAAADYLNFHVEAGRVTREQLEAGLKPADLELFDGQVSISDWVPVESFDRLAELTAECFGADDRKGYLRRHGGHVAKHLQSLGLYVQLELPGEASGDGPTLSLAHLRRTLTLWQGIVNFSEPTCEQVSEDPQVYIINVDSAEAFSDALRIANAGFLENVFGYLAEAPVEISIEDETPSHFVYRLKIQDE